MSALLSTPDPSEVLTAPGKGETVAQMAEREKRELKADLCLLTNAIKRYPARLSPKILDKMADLGWQLANDESSDSRARVAALKYMQALLGINAKLVLAAFEKRRKAEGEGPASGGTCIKVYNNINILNV
jgi:hypothetical protein